MMLAKQKLRSLQKSICLVALISVAPIIIGSYAIWVSSGNSTNEVTDKGLMKLEKKIGETYTPEMHQNFSDIARIGDDAIISMMGNVRIIGLNLLIMGIVTSSSSFVSLVRIKKMMSTNELAEQSGVE